MDKLPQNPPKIAERFLKWFCSADVLETLSGDLYELYQRQLLESGKRKADLHFFINVLDSCRPFAWKKRTFRSTNHLDMFKNNLKITLRNFSNNPGSNLLECYSD